jgi:hypothetical protein
MGRVHTSVVGSLPPDIITFPLYVTTQVCLLNVTLQPTLVKMRMLKRDTMVSSGMMCPIKGKGRPSMHMLHMCVDMTCHQSARETLRGFVVICLLITRVPAMTNTWVAPKWAMASLVLSVNNTPVYLGEVRKWLRVQDSNNQVNGYKMFDAMTVSLLSLMRWLRADIMYSRVGYNKIEL